jgi:hypothetical protein
MPNFAFWILVAMGIHGFAAVTARGAQSSEGEAYADIILHGGKILTVDKDFNLAQESTFGARR